MYIAVYVLFVYFCCFFYNQLLALIGKIGNEGFNSEYNHNKYAFQLSNTLVELANSRENKG